MDSQEPPKPAEDNQSIDATGKDLRVTHLDFNSQPEFVPATKAEYKLIGIGIATALVVIIGGVFLFSMAETADPTAEERVIELPVDENVAKDYQLYYSSGGTVYAYNPVKNESAVSAAAASPTLDHPVGDFSVSTAADGTAQVVANADGRVIVKFEDPATTIGNMYISPSGQFLAVDLRPTPAHQSEWGVRIGLYEIDVLNGTMEALLPETSPGQGDPAYFDHLIQVLSWSPDGRFIAYDKAGHLWLYDKYSGNSLDIADVGTNNRTPTVWQN
jgi:hypothetical protein